MKKATTFTLMLIIILFAVYGGTSVSANAAALRAPSVTKIEAVAEGARIVWSEVPNAQRYRVFVKSGSKWKKLGDTYSTAFTDKTAKAGKKYTYTVRCVSKDGKSYTSGYNKAGYTGSVLTAPTVARLDGVDNGIQITWGKITGAQKYAVFVKNGSSWRKLGTTTGTKFIDKTAKAGKKYTYTVRCLSADGKTWQSYFRAGTTTPYLATPSISASDAENGIKISWTPTSGTYKYRLFIKNGTKWEKVGDTFKTACTYINVKSGQSYTFTVRCIDKKGNYLSSYDKTGTTIKFLYPPTLSAYSGNQGVTDGIKIVWDKIPGAENYRVYRQSASSDWKWKTLGLTTATTFLDKNVNTGEIYWYTVRCADAKGNPISVLASPIGKEFTGSKPETTEPIEETEPTEPAENVMPKIFRSEILNDQQIKVEWNKVDSVAKENNAYRVYVKTGTSSAWTEPWDSIVYDTYYILDDVLPGETYIFTVRGWDEWNEVFVTDYDKTGYSVTVPVTDRTDEPTEAPTSPAAPTEATTVPATVAPTEAPTLLDTPKITDVKVTAGEKKVEYVRRNIKHTLEHIEGTDKPKHYAVVKEQWFDEWVYSNFGEIDDGKTDDILYAHYLADIKRYYELCAMSIDERNKLGDETNEWRMNYKAYYWDCRGLTPDDLLNYDFGYREEASETPGELKITWKKVSGAKKYRVLVKDELGWAKIGDTESNFFIFSGVEAEKTYIFSVMCIDEAGNRVSDFDSTGFAVKTAYSYAKTADGFTYEKPVVYYKSGISACNGCRADLSEIIDANGNKLDFGFTYHDLIENNGEGGHGSYHSEHNVPVLIRRDTVSVPESGVWTLVIE